MAEKQETALTCTVCLELFTEPKLLPCCHTYCKKCLKGILEKSKNKEKLICPQCRAEHKVLPNGVESFLSDYTIPLSHTSKSSKPTTRLCESCESKENAVAYCSDCVARLCESCLAPHKTVKFLKGHKVKNLSSEEYLVSGKPRPIHCSLHPDKVLELYCKTCQCVACLLCFVASHNGHDLGSINADTRKEIQQEIKDLIGQVDTKVKEFEEDLKYITEIEQDKTKESTDLKEEINKSFDSLVSVIEARRAALVDEVEAASGKDLKEIWAQKEVVETTIMASNGAISLASRSLQCTNDLELLLLGAQIKQRLGELKENKWDPTLIEQIETTLREYSHHSPSNMLQLGQIKVTKLGSLIPSEPSEPLSVFTETTTLQLGQPITLSIRSRKKGQPITLSVKCKQKSKKNKTALSQQKVNYKPTVQVLHGSAQIDIPHQPTVTADHIKLGAWLVTFTPMVSGEHVIVVEAKMEDGSTKKTESTISVTGEPPVGARVQRGPDWKFGNEDGGEGNPGTILGEAKSSLYKFRVQWDCGRTENYRWGSKNSYDLQLIL